MTYTKAAHASNTSGCHPLQFLPGTNTFGVVTPCTGKWAAFKKHSRADSRAIFGRKPLVI